MRIDYVSAKRARTLAERGLDFLDAPVVIETALKTTMDSRFNYGESTFNTFGLLNGRIVHVSWTRRDGAVRVISMRFANDRERVSLQRGMG